MDELCLRLDTEAPAGADRASATLWSALAERADDVVTCRVRRAKAVRAYLNAEGLEREEKLLEGLSNAALALSSSMDGATAKERASTALGKAACETLEASTTSREARKALDETEAAMAMESKHGVSLEFGGMLTAEVRRGFYKTRQGSPLGGDELAATAAFLESAKRLKTSIEGVTESGRRPRALVPLRAISGEMITHSELAEKIRGAVEETGEFRDNASPELRRARAQKGAAEGKLKKAMQGLSLIHI